MKYQFISDHKDQFPVVKIARCLHVSTRSYYDFMNKKYTARATKKESAKQEIKRSFDDSRRTYGATRIKADLAAEGIRLSEPTVTCYMREMGLRSIRALKYKVATTDSNHSNKVAENLLDRNFVATAPNQKWVSDITYIRVKGRFIYYTTVIDLFNREIIGWSISDDMTYENTVEAALKMALHQAGLAKSKAADLIFHSDRGSQYTCDKLIELLDKHGIKRSNSRKGNCWDNAVAESFFRTLKSELVYQVGMLSADEMKSRLFEYVVCWYNRHRRHSALGNLSICEFNKKYLDIYKFINAA